MQLKVCCHSSPQELLQLDNCTGPYQDADICHVGSNCTRGYSHDMYSVHSATAAVRVHKQ
eukprot:4371-Heterococcus_DN1.PRE.6